MDKAETASILQVLQPSRCRSRLIESARAAPHSGLYYVYNGKANCDGSDLHKDDAELYDALQGKSELQGCS